jgi:hypothetical protein
VLPEGRALLRRTASWTAIGAPVLLVPAWLGAPWTRALYAGAVLAAFAAYAARRLVTPDERALLADALRRRLGGRGETPAVDPA